MGGTNSNAGAPPSVKAADLCKYFTLSEGGRSALQPEMMPDQFAQELFRQQHHPDAVQVLAHYMPKRQAVFWALSCVKLTLEDPPAETDNAVKTTEKWISDPTEEHRKAALKAADAADAGTPAGCTALAAYYSDGLPKTEDPKQNARAYFLTSKLVAAAVLLAATADPDQMFARFQTFLEKGLEIVDRMRRH
jgi:hypothetical protein